MARYVRAPKETTEFHTNEFGRLPVLLNGRIQPMDTLARNALLQIAGKHTILDRVYPGGLEAEGRADKLSALDWLIELGTDSAAADSRFIFRAHHPEVIAELGLEEQGLEKGGLFWFAYDGLRTQRPAIVAAYSRASQIDAKERSHQDQQYFELGSAISLYERLKNSLAPEGSEDFRAELDGLLANVALAREELRKEEAGEASDPAVMDALNRDLDTYFMASSMAYSRPVPPDPSRPGAEWSNLHTNVLDALQVGALPRPVSLYAEMLSGVQTDDAKRFNDAVATYQGELAQDYPKALSKAKAEFFFNHWKPFGNATVYYVMALIATCVYWTMPKKGVIRQTAFSLVCLALVVHTLGIAYRIMLEGRPPVTNLYSSAIFVGWGAVVLGVILEGFFKRGIGIVVASIIGFLTLRIAHYLSLDGDTMQMLQAVLDDNFWLSTHVIVITLGYSATFLAGFLAVIYFVLGIGTKQLDKDLGKSLAKAVYGIVCFATLFSFVGTILGGIWADQSWGRFWGWDPKENGALLIVIWNAIILHAKWGAVVRERGLMTLALGGNIVTAFSWFGVNLLGQGLHSYGFMEGSGFWLNTFYFSQLALIAVGIGLPKKYWLSFRGTAAS